jgi:hypothetical protein
MEGVTTTLDREAIKNKIKESVEKITGQDLMVRNREKGRVEARYVAFKVMKDTFTRISLSEIARFFNLNHATVLHGLRSVNNWIEYDHGLNELYLGVMADVRIYLSKEDFVEEEEVVSAEEYNILLNRFKVLQNLYGVILNDYRLLIRAYNAYKQRHS